MIKKIFQLIEKNKSTWQKQMLIFSKIKTIKVIFIFKRNLLIKSQIFSQIITVKLTKDLIDNFCALLIREIITMFLIITYISLFDNFFIFL